MAVALGVLLGTACDAAEEKTDEPSGVVEAAVSSPFWLPFKCGYRTRVTQGNNSGFSHVGRGAYGFDFGVPLNTELVAARAGKVTFANDSVKPGNPCYSGGGRECATTLNYVTLDHGDGTSTIYMHLNATRVRVGQMVKLGEVVGLSGGTGFSTGPHTHVQRQNNCGAYYCQSVPMAFADVAGSGVPVRGDTVVSKNSCNGSCAAGDGLYCGGNGVVGDPQTLYRCTNGTPAVSQVCAGGCVRMPAGQADRCADGGGDAGTDAGNTQVTPPDDVAPEGADDPEEPTAPSTPLGERPPEAAASGCSTTGAPTSDGASSFALAGIVVALLLRAKCRRGRTASAPRRSAGLSRRTGGRC